MLHLDFNLTHTLKIYKFSIMATKSKVTCSDAKLTSGGLFGHRTIIALLFGKIRKLVKLFNQTTVAIRIVQLQLTVLVHAIFF